MATNSNNNKINEFTMTIRRFINTTILFIAFSFGNVRRLDINNKFIYLWQNAKGDVHYCFSLFEKEYYTTTATKLGNVLTQHFGCEIEAVNNTKEHLKKMINAATGLNKALADSNRYSEFQNYSQQNQLPPTLNNDGIPHTKEALLKIMDENSYTNNTQLQQYQTQSNQQHPFHNQEKLHEGVIQLSTYYLESHVNTLYIKLDDLPIIHKEIFYPNTKLAFFPDKNGLNYKNRFIPTELMVYPLNLSDPSQSFIVLFILFMVKNDIHHAVKIIAWLADSFAFLNKVPFALVLHSSDNVYMKLFYEEILEALFHDFQCEKIENNTLYEKSLTDNLDEKVIYNFHNIASPTILDESAYELTNKLIHKDNMKISRKNIRTVANILITSTSKYIPMISQDVPTATVEIDSNIDELCKHLNIRPNKNIIADHIKNDLGNFVSILRTIDIQALNKEYPIIDYSISDDLLDGNVDAAEVFNSIIKAKDITPFKAVATTKKELKLVNEIENNFKQNRVDKAHLLDYFEMLFGKGIYRSNRALISTLGKDYSDTDEPFDNLKTHVRKGRAYYFL